MTFRKRWRAKDQAVNLGDAGDSGGLLWHADVAVLVHFVPLLVAQGEFAQRVVRLVGLERQEVRREQGRLQQVAGRGDFGPVEQRPVRLFSNVLGNVLRRDQTLAGGCQELSSHTHTLSICDSRHVFNV